ncbi:hypothetical protein OCU04_009312 [Sclerotinia nivalis]|uniref:Uncharacterized protein n=1 Tax=Sclerotinia nivalis TaxID=352851 RepID=A0A9X0AET1_9HELO|nr:hypothetical protein OCU04_009312 [Sclerotinia nivalis]
MSNISFIINLYIYHHLSSNHTNHYNLFNTIYYILSSIHKNIDTPLLNPFSIPPLPPSAILFSAIAPLPLLLCHHSSPLPSHKLNPPFPPANPPSPLPQKPQKAENRNKHTPQKQHKTSNPIHLLSCLPFSPSSFPLLPTPTIHPHLPIYPSTHLPIYPSIPPPKKKQKKTSNSNFANDK